MWSVTAAGRVPVERRIGLICATEALEQEIPSSARVPFANKYKLKDITRTDRALRCFAARRVVEAARPVSEHSTHRLITSLFESPSTDLVSDEKRKLLDMVEWVRTGGLEQQRKTHPLASREQNTHSPPCDFNIGIALICGTVFFYRSGHHRLAIAQNLGIATVTVDLRLWDSSFNRLNSSSQARMLGNLGIEQSAVRGPSSL